MTRPEFLALLAAAWRPAQEPKQEGPRRLPDGRSQDEAILKAEYEKSLEDATELVRLAEELKAELEKNEQHVLSVSSIRRAEKIEELARRIKRRLRRF
jgi:hypothetical protein